MKILKQVGNYIIFRETDTDKGQYVKTASFYKETPEAFILKDTRGRGEIEILKSDVDGGIWMEADEATPYTQGTMLTFLQTYSGL